MISWILIGAGIGFVLEGAGFGSPRKLTGVFLLRDWAVPAVMGTAIVTAMAGGLVLLLFGTEFTFTPITRYAGQAVGGFVFGLGFFLGGYCPGTSVVGLASGRVDALAFMGGLVGGWFVWDAIREHLKPLLEKVARERDTLYELLGVDPRLLAAVFVVVGAGVIFWLFRLTAPKKAA